MSRKARVTFSYKPEQEDELTLEVGDIITNITDVDVGWCEGELNGKRGMFPDNFVEEFSTPGEEVANAAPLPSSNSKTGKKAKVAFDYEAQDADELTLHMGDVVDFMEEVEEGWWKGKLHGKVGVFPSNFVEMIEEEDTNPNQDKPAQIKTEKEPTVSHGRIGVAVLEDHDAGINKRHSGVEKAKQLPGGGMGFGNLVNPDMLAKKLKKVHHDEKKEKKDKLEDKNVPAEPSKTAATAKAPLGVKSRPAPPVPSTPPIVQPAKKPTERAKVMFDYEPENPDELKLTEGDIVVVTNQNIPDTEGWWEGELNGITGVFPSNFVDLLPVGAEEVLSKAPAPAPAPAPPQTHKKSVPVLPMKDELKKSPKLSRKHSPPVSPKEESNADAIPEVKKPVKDTSGEPPAPAPAKPKPPVAGQKPVLPPKKPLPIHKKPATKGIAKKPEKKAEIENSSVAKSTEEMKDLVDGLSAEKLLSQEEGISKPPEIKMENVEEGVSLDDIPATETLNHLTANRAKNLQKRPPSKEGRTDSARLSGGLLEEQIAETNKQPPERPKEPPREPSWKKEVREAREKKQVAEEKPPPLRSSKTEALEKRKSLKEEVPVPPVQKVEPFTTASGEVEKLRKEIVELREMMANMDKKHDDAIKRMEEKFTLEIEGLINDFDEERKHNAALKVELDRIKRRNARHDTGTSA